MCLKKQIRQTGLIRAMFPSALRCADTYLAGKSAGPAPKIDEVPAIKTEIPTHCRQQMCRIEDTRDIGCAAEITA
jgi:hypothetical protein